NVLGGAVASIVRSAVAATGDVTVEARNASVIGAEVQSAVTSAGNSVGVLMAFNSVGYRPSNILFSTINALLGGGLLVEENPVRAAATIEDSGIDAGGSIAVIAENTAQIGATLGNEATSLSEAMFGASAMSATGLLSSNKVSSSTEALVGDSDGAAGRR